MPLNGGIAKKMGVYSKLFKPLLFSFPAESAHELSLLALKDSQWIPGISAILKRCNQVNDPRLKQHLWGRVFPNPIGLAAGFDKNGEAINQWCSLGFGFFEVGTITPYPQSGNLKPRIFRLPKDRAIINRLGFNNLGAEQIAKRLEKVFSFGQMPTVPMGINIGKMKNTPLNEAHKDYLFCLERLYSFADYFTINISSPNTPGLRDLQKKENITKLLGTLLEKGVKISKEKELQEKPILVKLSPDFSDQEFSSLMATLLEIGVSGVVLTNTTVDRGNLKSVRADEEGGLSGAPLSQKSTHFIQKAKKIVKNKLILIGCGGIFSAADALEKINAGATLVQLYTGLVYEGPGLPKRINQGLLKLGYSTKSS